MNFRLRNRTLDLSQPNIMGILNVTPDSFSDGGLFDRPERALRHCEQMIRDGAVIIDVGGESTRPGASPVSTEEELERVVPVVERISACLDVAVSVDTSNPQVIREAAAAGAHLINDVRALRRNGAVEAVVETGLPVCLMHMRGEPGHMQDKPYYDDLMQDVRHFLQERIDVVTAAGVPADQIILDPGFGFGKNLVHNYTLLNRLRQILDLGYPVLTGLSRKRMIAGVLEEGTDAVDRDGGSAAAAVICAMNGARIIRAHNVRATWEAMQVVRATLEEGHV